MTVEYPSGSKIMRPQENYLKMFPFLRDFIKYVTCTLDRDNCLSCKLGDQLVMDL